MQKLRWPSLARRVMRLPRDMVGRWIRAQGFVRPQEAPFVPVADPHEKGVTPALRAHYPDIQDEAFWDIAHRCFPFTLLPLERLYDIYQSIAFICRHDLPGDIVECGVHKGGSVLAAAEALAHFGSTTRRIYLYDTFEGMTAPTAADVDFQGNRMVERYTEVRHVTSCFLEETRRNLRRSRYPFASFRFVKGRVEATIPGTAPAEIAVLRLDTDWYESIQHALRHLYPRLVTGGALMVDDYGFFQGARKAVDEFFADRSRRMLLYRVDFAGRSGIKCA